MAWTVEFDEEALGELRALDRDIQRRIIRYLRERIVPSEDPSAFAKPLRWDRVGLWRFRVGDHRLICDIRGAEGKVVVLRIGHRSNVYG